MNIVMTVKNRVQLTHQALVSLHRHTEWDWNLTIVDDNSDDGTQHLLNMFRELHRERVAIFHPEGKYSGILGALKNLGVSISITEFGCCDDWLYLSDNDVYFNPGWDLQLQEAAELSEENGFRLWGGQNHPFHLPEGETVRFPTRRFSVQEYGAVAGTSWLMRRETWEKYGPLNADAKGTQQSEDTAFCNRIRRAGYKVGAIDPPAVIDTGITQTDGTPSIGHEYKRRVPGVIYK